MTIFHEMYGLYYRITEKLLRRGKLTEQEVYDTIAAEGFRDSMLFLPQKLLPQPDGSDWGLLCRDASGLFIPLTSHLPKMPLTLLQKRWLKAKLSDEKLRLFLNEDEYAAMEAALAEIEPLYHAADFRFTDQFQDGDAFADEAYQKTFRTVLAALRSGELADITFQSGHGSRIRQLYLPLALEYSQKNDKFRLHCRNVRSGRVTGGAVINLGRIERIRRTGIIPEQPHLLEKYFAARRCKEPVTVRVSTARNAVERFLMEFASYEKHTERNLETGECTVQLWYDRQDETELLIQLLSFGSVIEILEPPAFRAQAAERVAAQYALLFGTNENNERNDSYEVADCL